VPECADRPTRRRPRERQEHLHCL